MVGIATGKQAVSARAPIAIRWRDDPVSLVRNSIVSAVPTHWDKRCGWSCALLNLAAAAALRVASLTPDELLNAGVAAIRRDIGGWLLMRSTASLAMASSPTPTAR